MVDSPNSRSIEKPNDLEITGTLRDLNPTTDAPAGGTLRPARSHKQASHLRKHDDGFGKRRFSKEQHTALKQHLALPTPSASPTRNDFRHRTRGGYEDGGRGLAVNGGSDGGLEKGAEREEKLLSWRQRVRHFTWTWFTMTMATGQLANVLYAVPYRFHGLYAIGCVFFLFNIALFIFNIVMISTRFRLYPSTFMASIRHPTESLFVPAAVISLGTILLNITEYGTVEGRGGLWLQETMVVMFWIYCALAMLFTCGIYLVMWSTQTFTIAQMTPVWIFPAYPLLVIGPHAAALSKIIDGNRGLDIIVGGFILQGIGFMVSLMVYAAFLYRLMTNKLPQESLRPGMFISVGPSGFTIAGVINMGQNLPRVIPKEFMGVDGALAGTITLIMANWMGIWLWGLAIFFLLVSVGAHWSCVTHGRLQFAMTWYSFVFPNTGLITATFAVGKALNNKTIKVLGCVLACILIVVWIVVFAMMIRAVVLRQILWPQKQEDRDEGGYSMLEDEERHIAAESEKEAAAPVGVRLDADRVDFEDGHAVR